MFKNILPRISTPYTRKKEGKMINILLSAKLLAKKANEKEIMLEHIKQAMQAVVFKDSDLSAEVLKYLKLENIENNQLVTEDELYQVKEEAKIDYSKETKDFLSFMKSKNIKQHDSVTEIYYANMEDKFSSNAEELINLGKIKSILSDKIFEQDVAIEAVKDTISRAIFEEKEDSVKALLFFVGPPATGKTFLSEETGKLLERYGYTTKVFNMTMYSDESSNLTGLKDPMHGAGQGDLTKFIKENPKALIVFDEIEKCHLQKQQDLFRLLDRGYIEDKYDNEIVRANDCIVVFTSNLGKDIYDRNDYSKMITNQQETESLILQSIAKEKHERNPDMLAITPPLTSRLSASKIVLFNKVGLKAYFNMAKKEIERFLGVIEDKFGTKFIVEDEIVLTSFLKYLPFFDPRRIKGKIGDDLFDILRDYIQDNEINISTIKTIEIKAEKDLKAFLDLNFIENLQELKFNDTRFLELIDNKETLFSDYSFKQTKSKLTISFSNARVEKIKNIQDFDGETKIELDIPSGKIEGEPNAKIFGHDQAKHMLVRIANKIQHFQDLQRKNDPTAPDVLKNIPKGILLYGPPGTGKTKLARAFAAQVGVPIVVTSGADMTAMEFKGTGVKKIKEVFKKVREYAPSILFIDEIDAIGSRGKNKTGSGNDEEINTLLTELDGFNNDHHKPVFVIAATNRKEMIDPAIIRPGRIEEHIEIPALTVEAREAFIKDMFESDENFASDIDVKQFLKYTAGMSGAELEQVFKKAKYNLEIMKEDKEDASLTIDLDMLIDLVNEIRYGAINKSRAEAKFHTMITAYHEAGHAIASMVFLPSLPIEQITVTPRGDFGGFVKPSEDSIQRYDKEFFIGRIATAYGGRVAEEIYFEKNQNNRELGISYGALQDIKMATGMLQDMILHLGMDDEFGLINYSKLEMSEHTKQRIDAKMIQWQKEIKEKTYDALVKNWDNMEKIVFALVGDETTSGKETLDGDWLQNLKIKEA